jgi:hypothetical protein
MWFNGQPGVVPNMKALSPQGGKVITGRETVGSGISFEGPMEPWKSGSRRPAATRSGRSCTPALR